LIQPCLVPHWFEVFALCQTCGVSNSLDSYIFADERLHLRCLRLRWACGLGLPQIGVDAPVRGIFFIHLIS